MILCLRGNCDTCGIEALVNNPFTCVGKTLRCPACPRGTDDEDVSQLGNNPPIVINEDIREKSRLARIARLKGLHLWRGSLNNDGLVNLSTLKKVEEEDELKPLGRPCGLCYSIGGKIQGSSTLDNFGPCPCRKENSQMDYHKRGLWLLKRQSWLEAEKTRKEEQLKRVQIAKSTQKEARRQKLMKRREGRVKSSE